MFFGIVSLERLSAVFVGVYAYGYWLLDHTVKAIRARQLNRLITVSSIG